MNPNTLSKVTDPDQNIVSKNKIYIKNFLETIPEFEHAQDFFLEEEHKSESNSPQQYNSPKHSIPSINSDSSHGGGIPSLESNSPRSSIPSLESDSSSHGGSSIPKPDNSYINDILRKVDTGLKIVQLAVAAVVIAQMAITVYLSCHVGYTPTKFIPYMAYNADFLVHIVEFYFNQLETPGVFPIKGVTHLYYPIPTDSVGGSKVFFMIPLFLFGNPLVINCIYLIAKGHVPLKGLHDADSLISNPTKFPTAGAVIVLFNSVEKAAPYSNEAELDAFITLLATLCGSTIVREIFCVLAHQVFKAR